MIKELKKLLSLKFPFNSDKELRTYLNTINNGEYTPKLLEKDFYLTALLGIISTQLPALSFKGGTCLNKIHFPYFRLSEDLDFSLPIDLKLVDNPGKRKRFATHMKQKIMEIATIMNRTVEHRNDRARGNKYIRNKKYTHLEYLLSYKSIYGGNDTIKIELTYTHKQCVPSVHLPIQHIYQDMVFGEDLFPKTTIQCLDISEMIAEKTRAALTRQKPAIRDFYDLRYITQKKGYILEDYMQLINEKCEDSDWRWTIESFAPDQHLPNTSLESLPVLHNQIQSDLTSVLIEHDGFDLDQIHAKLLHIKNVLLASQ